MATLKAKELKKMNLKDREKKMKDLKFELVKAKASKSGNSKAKEIRKIIARIHTINNENKTSELNKQ